MAKLFFDFDDGRTVFKDQEGFEVANLDAGRDQVLRTLAEIVKEALPKGDDQTFQANVLDAAGNRVYSATVKVSGTWHSVD